MRTFIEKKRLMSLDALRGFDMLFIIGLPAVICAVSNLLGWGTDWWLPVQMKHVPWHGWHLMDGVFPVFLFVSGVSWPFSYASRLERGASRAAICLGVLRRAATLFALGLLCEGLTYVDLGWQAFRFGSVLGRIGIAWGCAALLYVFCAPRVRLAVAALILAGYWIVPGLFPAPDAAAIASAPPATGEIGRLIEEYGSGPWSLPGALTGWFDRTLLPGRLRFAGILDTQGTLSTLPAVCLPLFGVFAGEFVRRTDMSGGAKAARMISVAGGLALLGWAMAHWCGAWSVPFNRSIWTSSHILWSGGYALALFAVFYWLVDVKMWRRWTFFFRVIGMNAIAVWMATRLYGVGHHHGFNPLRGAADWLFGGLAAVCGPQWGALVSALGYVAVCWGALYFLYRKNIFFRA